MISLLVRLGCQPMYRAACHAILTQTIFLALITVNLHIEKLNTAKYFGKEAVLLAWRPIQIAGKDVSKHFCKYEPAAE